MLAHAPVAIFHLVLIFVSRHPFLRDMIHEMKTQQGIVRVNRIVCNPPSNLPSISEQARENSNTKEIDLYSNIATQRSRKRVKKDPKA